MAAVVVVAAGVRGVGHRVYYAQVGSVLVQESMDMVDKVAALAPASAEVVELERHWKHSAVQLVRPPSRARCNQRDS